jgi:hypothetical protein
MASDRDPRDRALTRLSGPKDGVDFVLLNLATWTDDLLVSREIAVMKEAE